MKKIVIIYMLFIGAFLFSCSLQEEPITEVTSNNFYQNATDAELGINGIYNMLAYMGNTRVNYTFVLGDMPSDNISIMNGNAARAPLNNFSTTADNTVIYEIWQKFYEAINRANVALENIPGISMDETLKNRYLGEAKFLRGLYYFYLVRWFGDIPLVLVSAKDANDLEAARKTARTPADQVYTQIIKDFMDAEASLPAIYTGTNLGRATSGAAKAFLAKIYLTRKQWQQSRDKAKELIDNKATYGYNLWPRYADAFNANAIANENRVESVFETQHAAGATGTGNGLPTALAATGDTRQGNANGFGSIPLNSNLVNGFAAGDQRKEGVANNNVKFIDKCTCDARPFSFIYKYMDPGHASYGEARNNFPILRYADVVLMYAEASNELTGGVSEAVEYTNKIRRRAYNTSATANFDAPNAAIDLPAGISQSDLRDAIIRERRLEFYTEGQRWFDLVRTGRLVSTIKALPDDPNTQNAAARANVQEKHNLFPIPQTERNANPALTQNPGY